MRNFKKLIAMGTALAMAIIMNVSAFADGDGTQASPYTNAYDNGAVVVSAIKAALPTMTEGAQYTVVVIPVLGEDEEISDSNIHYINQADGADAIWAESTTWGTPAALADGTYVVRVGDEAGNVDETYFRVGSTQPPVQQGPKVIFKNGATLVEEVASVDGKIVLTATVPTFAETGTGYAATTFTFVEWVKADGTAIKAGDAIAEDLTVYPKYDTNLIHGNVNDNGTSKGVIDTADRAAIQQKVANNREILLVGKQASSLATDIMGNVNDNGTSKGVIDTADRAAIQQKVANNREILLVGKKIYVINKEN